MRVTMQHNLNLSPSIVEAFYRTERPFVIHENRLFTVHEPGDKQSNNSLYFKGKHYYLFPSDKLTQFRNERFLQHEPQIKDYMNWVISFKLVRRLQDAASGLEQGINYYDKLKEDSVQSFMLKVFDIYNHQRNGKEQPTVNDTAIDTMLDDLPGIEDLLFLPDAGGKIFPRQGLLSTGQTIYTLTNPSNKPKNWVRMGAKMYSLEKNTQEISTLIKEYDSETKAQIEKQAFDHGKHIVTQLTSIKKRSLELNKLINKYNTTSNNAAGAISYHHLKNNQYEVVVKIPPFLFEKEGKYYCFKNDAFSNTTKQVELGTTLRITQKNVTIKHEPKVLNMPYFHPFIHDGGKICYNGVVGNPWKYYKIKFSHAYPRNEEGIARKIALALWEGKKSVTHGMLGTKAEPVYDMDRFPPVATTREGALAFAKKNHIQEKYVYGNENGR